MDQVLIAGAGPVGLTMTAELAANGNLAVSGSVVNNRSIILSGDKQTIAGAVSGFGSTNLSNNSTLEFDSTVVAAQTVRFNGADSLVLGNLTADKGFAASISNFGVARATIALAVLRPGLRGC